MKRIFIAVACLCVSLSHAQVYKWVDEKGEVHFGDQPPSEQSAEKVKLPELQRTRPFPVPSTEAGQGSGEATAEPEPFNGYESLTILQPGNGATVRSNEQKVTVFIGLKPELQADHQVSLVLDGSVIGAGAVNAPMDLTGVVRGAHTLQARVVDAAGQLQIESAEVRFTLRQSGVAPFSQPQNPAGGKPPAKPFQPTLP